MPAGPAFGDVLDEAIAAGCARTAFRPIATPPLLGRPIDVAPFGRPAYGGASPLPPGPPRRRQPRTREELDAFDRLKAAGAGLSSSFTPDELRGAFRRLARELHPDRHVQLTEAERARLGQRFAVVREDYLILRRSLADPSAA